LVGDDEGEELRLIAMLTMKMAKRHLLVSRRRMKT